MLSFSFLRLEDRSDLDCSEDLQQKQPKPCGTIISYSFSSYLSVNKTDSRPTLPRSIPSPQRSSSTTNHNSLLRDLIRSLMFRRVVSSPVKPEMSELILCISTKVRGLINLLFSSRNRYNKSAGSVKSTNLNVLKRKYKGENRLLNEIRVLRVKHG